MSLINVSIIIEEMFIDTVWCNEIMKGLKQANNVKLKIISPSSIKSLDNNSTVLIVGSSNKFIASSVNLCISNNLRPIIVGAEYNDTSALASYVNINRKQAISEAIDYFDSIKRTKIALLGTNSHSHTDEEKKVEFLNKIRSLYGFNASSDIFYSNQGIEKCISSLIENIDKYNAVICSNDYFAIAFIIDAKKAGKNIPDDIAVMGFGNSYIGQKISPTLSSIAPNYFEMGRQAIKTYSFLNENLNVVSCNTYVDYKIIPRESTSYVPYNKKHFQNNNIYENFQSTLQSKKIVSLLKLDHILSSTDDSIEKIIDGIMNDISYTALAEKLYLSDTAFKYKLKKIFSVTNTSSKKELAELLNSVFKE